MAKCSDIISTAFRLSGVTAPGVALGSMEQTIGLEQLQGMYTQMINGKLLGKLTEYYLASGNYTAKEGQRIYKATPASVITNPTTVTDANTGEVRAPLDGAIVVVVDPVGNIPVMSIYNGMMGKWQQLSSLAATDDAPLSYQFEMELKNMLAAILADENGLTVPPLVAKRAALGKVALAQRIAYNSTTSVGDYS